MDNLMPENRIIRVKSGVAKYFDKYSLSTLMIIALIFFVSAVKTYDTLPQLKTILSDNNKSIIQKISLVKNAYINSFSSFDETFLELHSAVTKVQGKEVEIVDGVTYAKDSKGDIHRLMVNKKINVTPKVNNIINAVKYAQKKNIKTLVSLIPPNVEDGVTKLPVGVVDYQNMYADKIMSKLKDNGIYSVDMRNELPKMGIDMSKLFFNTDHHWEIQSSFIAKNLIVNSLNKKYDLNIDENGFYADLKNYSAKTYKNSYYGAYATALGKSFVGASDDFTTILPNFDTEFNMQGFDSEDNLKKDFTLNKPCDLTGSFQNVLFDQSFISKNSVKSYQAYLRGVTAKAVIENKKASNNLKVLVLGTSHSRPLAAFLSLCVKSVACIDLQRTYYEKSAYKFIDQYKPDVIVFIYSPETFEKIQVFNYDE